MDHPAIGDAYKFLDLWFGEGIGERPNGYILVWTNPGKRSEWFIDIQKVVDYAVAQVTKDVYFGTCLADRSYSARQRLHSKDRPAKALMGLWADIDFTSGEHKKKNYPPDLESALKLVADVPILPSAIIETGGGIHCYWAFHEAWVFEDNESRAKAQALTRKWHHLLLTAAEARGWTMDNVSDLERVMRIPGTFNNKDPRHPKPVIVSSQSAWRFSPDDFDMFLKEVNLPSVVVPELHPPKDEEKSKPLPDSADALLMSLEANPPIEKFEALIANDRVARDTWNHKRKDLKDQSGSSYDMSMANYCVRSGFTLQETVNTLIAMRRKHDDPNLVNKMREGYFKGTFEKAYATFSEEAELNRKRELAHQKFVSSDEEARRKGALELFNEMVGTDIVECIAFKTEITEYHIKTAKGETVMSFDQVWSFSKFSKGYFGAFDVVLPEMKLKEWKTKALPMLVNHATKEGTLEKVVDEGSDRSSMRGWVEDYLTASRVHRELTAETYKGGYPVKDEEGNHFIRNDSLRRFIGRRRDNKIPVGKMPSLLRSAGLEPILRKVIGTGAVARYWKLPAEKVIPFPQAKAKGE